MFTISKNQLKDFEAQSQEQFVLKSLDFLEANFKDWTRGQDEYDLRTFIVETIELGEKIGIRKEVNVQKMMAIRVKHEEVNFDIFLEDEYKKIRTSSDEELKFKLLHRSVITIQEENDNTNLDA